MTLKFKKGDRVTLNGKMRLLLENHTAPEATFEDDVVEITKVHDRNDYLKTLFYSISSEELRELTREKNIMVYADRLEEISVLVEKNNEHKV